MTTRDVIRTLCWDRVRAFNRQTKSTKHQGINPKQKEQKEHRKADPQRDASGHSAQNRQKTGTFPEVDSDTPNGKVIPLKAKPPRTLPRAKIPTISTTEVARSTNEKAAQAVFPRGPILPTSPALQYFPYSDLSSPINGALPDTQPNPDDDIIEVKVRGKKQIFARDIDYEEFDNALQSVLTVEETHMRCYF